MMSSSMSQGQRIAFPFRSILEAKLVLTDKLIQEDLKARKSARSVGASRSDN